MTHYLFSLKKKKEKKPVCQSTSFFLFSVWLSTHNIIKVAWSVEDRVHRERSQEASEEEKEITQSCPVL